MYNGVVLDDLKAKLRDSTANREGRVELELT